IPLPLQLPARIDDSIPHRNFGPIVQPLPPVVQPPDLVELIRRLEPGLQVIYKANLHIWIGSAGRGSLVINLIANDVRIILVMFQESSDDALAIEAVSGMGEIGVLTQAIVQGLAAQACDDDLGVLLVKPGGDGIGRSSENNLDSRRMQLVYDAVHPCELELPFVGLPETPTRLADSHHADAGLLHQADILI